MAELVFFTGTMDCGKSTLALQTDHNYAARGLHGCLLTRMDRSGRAMLSSRLGLATPAVEVTDDTDLWDLIASLQTTGRAVDYVICDEAQFYTPTQIEHLARVVDEMGIEVFCFGITVDFRAELFPGSRRLIELADRVEVLQVRALCWCGARATHNARVVDGVMVLTGEQVIVGDTGHSQGGTGHVDYEVLCRRHFMRRMPSRAAHAAALGAQVLPFDLGVGAQPRQEPENPGPDR
ncbi:MAG: thymidine kinase [Nostocoides sp.]